MRVLLIEDDPAERDRLQHRLTGWKPEIQVVVRSPVRHGPLAPEFLAQGFDAVLLTRAWTGGSGLDWLRDCSGRVPELAG